VEFPVEITGKKKPKMAGNEIATCSGLFY